MTRHTAVFAAAFALLGPGVAHAQSRPTDDPARAPNTPAQQEAEAESAASSEVELTFAERKVVQERLRDKGYYQGVVDGMFGKATRAAIGKFQEANQLTVTSKINPQTCDVLGIETKSTKSTETAAAPAASPAGTTTSSTEELKLGNERTLTLSAMEPAAVRAIQRRLQTLGFYEGAIDGVAGQATRDALTSYYKEQIELVNGGKLLAEGALAFNLNAADIEPVRGQDKPAKAGKHDERKQHDESADHDEKSDPRD
jgi:peptidoglycan hydrolase-like protein with peptidoglycan-binding domain